MRLVALASASLVAVSCGDYKDPLDLGCDALSVALVDRAIAPPANVAALVRVTDCHGAALGAVLPETAFTITENGRVLSTFEATRVVAPVERPLVLRTLIALDLSGSIVRSGLRPAMIDGARQLVRALGPEHQVAIFGFDGRADLVPFAHFTSDRAALDAALDEAANAPLVDDSTNLNGAVVDALGVLDRAVEHDGDDDAVTHGALVLFTDGQDLAGRVGGELVKSALDHTRHSTFAIGLGDADAGLLAALGRSGHERAADATDVALAFERVGVELVARAQAGYVVSYCSPARAGTRRFELTVEHDGLTGRTSLDFDATGFGPGCSPDEPIFR
ncbi:hypothetical protein L6R52_15990 [Myxococcota bacterium]|nr:hypothetical protein [Myxococcota bacterium]